MTAVSKDANASARWGFGLAPPFDAVMSRWTPLVVFLALMAWVYAQRTGNASTEAHFFWRQDLPVIGLYTLLLAALPLARPAFGGARLFYVHPKAWLLGLSMVCLAVGVIGAPLVFGGYRLSLDEFMAQFDARIFAHGQFVAATPPAWRPYVPALQPIYALALPRHEAWASAYLPVNAALRALAGQLHAEALLNPLLSALSIVAVFGVARRLWPERLDMALGAAALLASSSQLLVMSMTAYAMPAHLAFNLVWLWLFLRGGRLGHAGALIVAFLACGLHQLIFHPLFAAPFVLQLWLDRRWRLALVYTLGYAAIGLFWVFYCPLALALAGVAPAAAGALGGGWLVSRTLGVLSQVRLDNFGEMALSLVRFVTWQNPLTAPLALIGALAAERAKGHLRALVFGVFLTLAAMLLLMPSQTHGWGYRYLHGLLGSVCLLAIWTWARLTDGLAPPARARAGAAFVVACGLSIFVFLPLRAWQAWRYVAPYAEANALIQRAPAQVVLVDPDDGVWFDMGVVVRNDPFLAGGPKVMALSFLTEPMVRQLCARYSVAVFDGQSAQALGIDVTPYGPAPQVAELRQQMRRIGCGRPIP